MRMNNCLPQRAQNSRPWSVLGLRSRLPVKGTGPNITMYHHLIHLSTPTTIDFNGLPGENLGSHVCGLKINPSNPPFFVFFDPIHLPLSSALSARYSIFNTGYSQGMM